MKTLSGQTGSVTAELAAALPALVILVAVVAGTGVVARAHVECRDAAWLAARMVARGEPVPAGREAALRAAPRPAVVTVSTGDDTVSVRIDAQAVALPPAGPTLPVTCEATVPAEAGDVGGHS